MKNPGFYCINFIECQHYIKMYQPNDCKHQCDNCINKIIEYHSNKEIERNRIKILNSNSKKYE